MKPFLCRVNRRRYPKNLYPFINLVLKQIHPSTGISCQAMGIINSLLIKLMGNLVTESMRLTRYNKKGTLTSREVQTAARVYIPGDLLKYAVRESTNAVLRFGKPGLCEGISMTYRASLTFPVPYFLKELKKQSQRRVTKLAGVYLAATLEYICAELLDMSGNAAREARLSTIKPCHIFNSVSADADLNVLFKGLVTDRGFAVPLVPNS